MLPAVRLDAKVVATASATAAVSVGSAHHIAAPLEVGSTARHHADLLCHVEWVVASELVKSLAGAVYLVVVAGIGERHELLDVLADPGRDLQNRIAGRMNGVGL